MLNPQDTLRKTKIKDCYENSLQYSNQSTELILNPQKLKNTRTVVTLLKNFVNHKILNQSFNLIHRYAMCLKNKELIYAAIYKKNSSSQNEQITARKKRQEIKIQTINKQKLEEFLFTTDDISTIIMDRSEDNEISNKSRIDLQNILEIGTFDNNKFITTTHTNHRQIVHEKTQFISITQKKSQISKNNQLQRKKQADLSNKLHFQSYNYMNTPYNDNSVKLNKGKSIKFNVSQANQTHNSRVHQIYIVRQKSTKSNRANSQPISSKETYISVPLKYQKIQVIQLFSGLKKQTKISQSLDSKNCTKTCADNCETPSIEEKCRHCCMVQKSFQIVKRLKQSTY